MSHNNWLSLDLDIETRKNLHDIAEYIKINCNALFGENVSFEPMKYDDIHMTAIFIGDKIYANMHNYNRQSICTIINSKLIQHYELTYEGYKLFPPNKQNLIVVTFTCSQKLLERINDIVIIMEKNGFVGLKQLNNFTPHITLGKIRATKQQIDRISQNNDLHHIPIMETKSFITSSLYLCGEISKNKKMCKYEENEFRTLWKLNI